MFYKSMLPTGVRAVRGADAPGLPSGAEPGGLGWGLSSRGRALRNSAGCRQAHALPPAGPPSSAGCVSMPTSSGQRPLSYVLTSATQLSKRRGNKEL